MACLHLNFDNFEFRDLGHSYFLSFKVLAPTRVLQISSLFVSILHKDDRVYVPKVGRTISFVLGIQ